MKLATFVFLLLLSSMNLPIQISVKTLLGTTTDFKVDDNTRFEDFEKLVQKETARGASIRLIYWASEVNSNLFERGSEVNSDLFERLKKENDSIVLYALLRLREAPYS